MSVQALGTFLNELFAAELQLGSGRDELGFQCLPVRSRPPAMSAQVLCPILNELLAVELYEFFILDISPFKEMCFAIIFSLCGLCFHSLDNIL